MRFVEELWSPQESGTCRPLRQLIAHTGAGVSAAVTSFVEAMVPTGERAALLAGCERHHRATVASKEYITFRDAFLHLGGLTKEGLLVLVCRDMFVQSIDVHKGTTRGAIASEEAHALFAQGMLAVVIDAQEQYSVTAYAKGWTGLHCAPVSLPVAPPTARVQETRALIGAASAALLNDTWELPLSTSGGATAAPPTAA